MSLALKASLLGYKNAWSTFTELINERLSEDTLLILLPWDDGVHPKLRSDNEEIRQNAVIAIRQIYGSYYQGRFDI